MSNQYQCSMCKGVFEKGWPDNEARQERTEIFGEYEDKDCDIVCDNCFQTVKPISYKEARAIIRKDEANFYRQIENHKLRRLVWKTQKEAYELMINLILYGVTHSGNI